MSDAKSQQLIAAFENHVAINGPVTSQRGLLLVVFGLLKNLGVTQADYEAIVTGTEALYDKYVASRDFPGIPNVFVEPNLKAIFRSWIRPGIAQLFSLLGI